MEELQEMMIEQKILDMMEYAYLHALSQYPKSEKFALAADHTGYDAARAALISSFVQFRLHLDHLLLHFLGLTHQLLHIPARDSGEATSSHNDTS